MAMVIDGSDPTAPFVANVASAGSEPKVAEGTVPVEAIWRAVEETAANPTLAGEYRKTE